jgi:LytS/YehU family sensor histidine kinase
MNKWLTYENIWARNVIFLTLLVILQFAQNKFSGAVVAADGTVTELFGFVLLYVFIFVHNHFFVRKLLLPGKYVAFSAVMLVAVLVLGTISYYFLKWSGEAEPFVFQLVSAFTTLLMGTVVYFAHHFILNNLVRTKLKLLNKEAEISFLKQQLSPHFLFNAINNLYGVSLAAPELISEKILELSDLLRYQVESTSKIRVSLKEERAFIDSYLSYVNFRSNNLHITNETKGQANEYQLPPLLFLPLIENAVKYAAESPNPFIRIMWAFENRGISFSIRNSCLPDGSKVKGTKLGLENLRQRLELLNIKHELNTDTSTEDIFKIELKLWELATNA